MVKYVFSAAIAGMLMVSGCQSKSGGNAEALTPDCGIIVPAENPRAMAAAALDLIEAPERCEVLTHRARIMAEKRFTSERHVQQVREVYHELVDKPRRPGLLLNTRSRNSSFQPSAPR